MCIWSYVHGICELQVLNYYYIMFYNLTQFPHPHPPPPTWEMGIWQFDQAKIKMSNTPGMFPRGMFISTTYMDSKIQGSIGKCNFCYWQSNVWQLLPASFWLCFLNCAQWFDLITMGSAVVTSWEEPIGIRVPLGLGGSDMLAQRN